MDIKKIIKTILGIKAQTNFPVDPALNFQTLSYSQEGEDLVLKRFAGEKENGFYVDIGAHHPFRFSNTYLFYKLGWRGINVDAMPASMKAFNIARPKDINLEIPVSDKKQVLTYHIFNEPALNTFSLEEAQKKDGLRDYKIIQKIELETLPLSEILDKYLPENTEIDFLTIDVEGLDFAVLRSNNWNKYRPNLILIESLRNSLEEMNENEIYQFLKAEGYQIFAKTINTMFFKKSLI